MTEVCYLRLSSDGARRKAAPGPVAAWKQVRAIDLASWRCTICPQSLVPVINALVRDRRSGNAGERPLYAVDDDGDV